MSIAGNNIFNRVTDKYLDISFDGLYDLDVKYNSTGNSSDIDGIS